MSCGKRSGKIKLYLPVAIVQNLKRLAVQRVRVRVAGELVLDASNDGVLVVVEPGLGFMVRVGGLGFGTNLGGS